MAGKGKWAQGIPPRNFAWIMKDRFAVSERPGGYGANHRRVRRQEEIIWIREQQFDVVISIIPAPHNLHNYDDLGVTWRHRGFDPDDEPAPYLTVFYPELRSLLDEGKRILLHQEALNDSVCGLVTGYLVWAGLLPQGPEAVTLIEQMVARQLGPYGRELVAVAAGLPNASASAKAALAEASAPPKPAEPARRGEAAGGKKATPAKRSSARKTSSKKSATKKAAKKKAPAKSKAKKAPAKAKAKKAPTKKAPAKKAPAKSKAKKATAGAGGRASTAKRT